MTTTPMMEQYLSFKNQYPGKIVLFRMGDFFETFGDDAKIVSKILNITLTSRDRNTDPTPLAGFPHHALNQYLPKIINGGYCAVIVDQIEDPKLAKGIVKRAVVRVVTPATIDNEEKSKNSFLGAFVKIKKDVYCSFLDIQTGDFTYTSFPFTKQNFSNLVTSYDPSEVLIIENETDLVFSNIPIQPISKKYLNISFCSEILQKFFNVKTVSSLGFEKEDNSIAPVAMCLDYILETQKIAPVHIKKPQRFNIGKTMVLDRATVTNLELIRSSYGNSPKNSLLHVIDQTKTNMGKRMLFSWILNPLIEIEEIKKRLDVVDYYFKNNEKQNSIREQLSSINDIERIVGKIGLNRMNARDLKALQYSLEEVVKISNEISEIKKNFEKIASKETVKEINKLVKILESSIDDNPPLAITQGYIIKKGYNKEIDEIQTLAGDNKSWIKEFEAKEKKRTGISTLKIGFTKVFGYYIEVTHANTQKVPDDYIRKQTLVSAERYITEELKQKEDLILNAQERLGELEYKIFQEVRSTCIPYLSLLQEISKEIATLDILSGFAHLAQTNNYCKPEMFDFGEKNGIVEITDGRHPVIEQQSEDQFVSNDTKINVKDSRMCILTGPNMSGKSTYIRQVAIIVIMAQIGCFVPASKCLISLVDRVFTRVGASDDLGAGRSTFMVEMDEAANILNSSTKYSLIILDEIGRGTSTYDGVSIAWAISEYLVNEVKARTLFATHYHELLKLPQKIEEGIKNYNVLVQEDVENGTVIFLRKIVEGGTDRSYGIHVAKMAGLPIKVIGRAKEILESFEQESMFKKNEVLRDSDIPVENNNKRKRERNLNVVQIPLFNMGDNGITKEIKEVDLENLTPLQALNLISKLKEKAKS
ncbi:DNA mismatch repair protein MutS [Candidatus Dojkabacteria bacterium]|jgi:DNA mismatch repair protein MutS|nr:DNA mismatch repair protein MutS [Candidatus Dojkabacteria bacterium]